MMKPQTLKGFRDFLPQEARKRQYIIQTLKNVFEQAGFEPLETPVLEYEEILTGKYGDEGEKLMYRFEDQGKRKVAMRYDQTVPLARVVAQYQNEIAFPFKRYQIQPVWRAENPQKGRYREFIQCDIDTVGVDSALADAETIATALKAYEELGFKSFKILINDRTVFEGLSPQAVIIIDKLKKIGEAGVCQELASKNIFGSVEEAQNFLRSMLDQKPTQRLMQIFALLESLGIDKKNIEFSPTLARGLNYYTGMIFEIETPEYPYGSLCGGGRYNDLIGIFAGRQIPAVGFAVGFDRTLEAMEALQLFPTNLAVSSTQVLVTIFSAQMQPASLQLYKQLYQQDIPTEIYLGEIKDKNPLEKQLKYANQKAIPYVIIIGEEEIRKNVVILKNMQTREQQQITEQEAIKIVKDAKL
jgi:histidyl-tRNA synthetase